MEQNKISMAIVPIGNHGLGPINWTYPVHLNNEEIKIVIVSSQSKEGIIPILESNIEGYKGLSEGSESNFDLLNKAFQKAKDHDYLLPEDVVFKEIRAQVVSWMIENEVWPLMTLRKKEIIYVENL